MCFYEFKKKTFEQVKILVVIYISILKILIIIKYTYCLLIYFFSLKYCKYCSHNC